MRSAWSHERWAKECRTNNGYGAGRLPRSVTNNNIPKPGWVVSSVFKRAHTHVVVVEGKCFLYAETRFFDQPSKEIVIGPTPSKLLPLMLLLHTARIHVSSDKNKTIIFSTILRNDFEGLPDSSSLSITITITMTL